MVQDKDIRLSPDEQAHVDEVTRRIIDRLHPAATPLGDAIRQVGALLDGAPSILTAAASAPWLTIRLEAPEAVLKVAEDLGRKAIESGDNDRMFTSFWIADGIVSIHVFAEHTPTRELHRPVDVTETIEEQEQ